MPKFVILSNWEGEKEGENEPDVVRTVREDVKKSIEENGGEVIKQYALLGEYDFLSLVKAPSFASVTRALMPLNTIKDLKTTTMPATDIKNI